MVARDLELVRADRRALPRRAHQQRRFGAPGARGQAARAAGHLRGDAAPPDADRRGVRRLRHRDQVQPAAAHGGRRRRRCARRWPTAPSTRSRPTTRRTRRSRRTSSSSRRRSACIGLETALPLVLELVRAGSLTPAALVDALTGAPGGGVRPAGRHAGRRARRPTSRSSTPSGLDRATPTRCGRARGTRRFRDRRCAAAPCLTVVGGTIAYSGETTDVSHDDDRALPPALLAMEDGTVFRGVRLRRAGDGDRRGRLQHRDHRLSGVLTDPSYRGQIVTMTAPEIGNVGVNPDDFEADASVVRGLRGARAVADGVELARVGHRCTRCSPITASPASRASTRARVTRRIRDDGRAARRRSRRAVDDRRRRGRARAQAPVAGRPRPRARGDRRGRLRVERAGRGAAPDDGRATADAARAVPRRRLRLRHQARHPAPAARHRAAASRVVPGGDARRATCWRMKPDGIFLSNGPGDPAAVGYAIEAARELIAIEAAACSASASATRSSGLALGGKTYKLQVRPPRRQPPGAWTSARARSRSPRRTTASRSTSIRCRGGRCCRTSA